MITSDAVLSFAWTLSDNDSWLSPYDGSDPLYRRFASAARSSFDARPLALLRRQRALFKRHGLPIAALDWALERRASLRQLNRLEATLFLAHWRDKDPARREFQAFILRRPGSYRVYFTQSDAHRAWPWSPKVKVMIRANLDAGWTLFAHLHNHPFFFDNPSGDIAGTPAPSGQDAALYRELAVAARLQRAWITNGLDTLEIPVAEFPSIPGG